MKATPLVIDTDADGKPEFVFVSYIFAPMKEYTDHRLHAISGADCKELWSAPTKLWGSNFTELVAGDLDGDGRPEIVIFGFADKVVHVHGPTGALVASSEAIPEWGTGEGQGQASSPAIADVDGKPPAEVILGAAVLRLEGGKLTTVWKAKHPEPFWGSLALAADLDLDGKPEVVVGNRIFDGMTGVDETPAGLASVPAGYPAVAQFDPATPEPELVLVSPKKGEVRVIEVKTGAVSFGPYDIFSGGLVDIVGGGPVVADFDGDGKPEIGVTGPGDYHVYDPECAASPPPGKCVGPGLLWKSKTKDFSSGGTSSSVFDFNNDCNAEVVYRDECWLRIYEGKSGKVLAAYAITSGTALEEPVIADVDGDGHAEIVVSSDNVQDSLPHLRCPDKPELHSGAPWTGYTQGVFVLRDPMERWAPARPVWNQNTYHVTNVNADGTIPIPEARSWEGANNYRQNVRP